MEKRKLDIVVLSDVHLGTYGCRAKELCRYLSTIDPNMLILNGDIIDVWQFSKKFWPKSHMQVLKQITSMLSLGVKVYYITGNHDEILRRFENFSLGDFHIVGSSPEVLARLEDGQVTVRPIAGTRRRGKSEEEDLALEQNMLDDPKEIAEHLMLIDLGRNDVGRISKPGTVEVTEKMVVERYSHVMHITSNVVGEVTDNMPPIDVLKATLPAGTLSGAPKIRAMEIIDEVEPVKRGVYGGAVGYIGWNGNMDTAIAIRTAVIKDDVLHVQAGAGVVADSIPELEWKETMNKARAIMRAAAMVCTGVDK